MGAKITKRSVSSDKLAEAPFTIEDLADVKIGLKQVQTKEGGVDLKNWQKVWKKASGLEGEFVDSFFQMFDEAGNGWVDFREYAVWAALVGRTPVRRKISYAYRIFDKNGNGVLEPSELAQLTQAVFRCVKRVGANVPGQVNEDGPQAFELSSKEAREAKEVADLLMAECVEEGEDGASYRLIQSKWDTDKKFRDVKKLLNWFQDISENLSSNGGEPGPYAKKYASAKGEEGKGKKKGKKGKQSSDESSDDKPKSKKGKKKGKKGNKSSDESSDDKPKSKKGKKKGSKKGGDSSDDDKPKSKKGKKKGKKGDDSSDDDKKKGSKKAAKAGKAAKAKGKDKAAKAGKAAKAKGKAKAAKAGKAKGKKKSKK